MKYALISHSHKQLSYPAPGHALWISNYFKLKQAWCLKNGYFYSVLSPYHGVVTPGTMREPYDWKKHKFVLKSTKWLRLSDIKITLPQLDTFIVLGGSHYVAAVQFAIDSCKNLKGVKIEAPLKGLRIGEKQAWLRRELFVDAL